MIGYESLMCEQCGAPLPEPETLTSSIQCLYCQTVHARIIPTPPPANDHPRFAFAPMVVMATSTDQAIDFDPYPGRW